MRHRAAWYPALLLLGSLVGGCATMPARDQAQVTEPTATSHASTARELRDIGLNRLTSGDTLRAEEYLVSALQAGCPAREVLGPLMRAAVAGRRYQSAIRYYEDFRDQVDGTTRAELELVGAVLYLGVEQPERARSALEKSLELRPDPLAHVLLAQLLREQEDYARAEVHFKEYLRLAPQGEYAALARAGLLKSTLVNSPGLARVEEVTGTAGAPRRIAR